MNDGKINIINDPDSVLENLTRTLLYEGYSLYPYYRSAIKNQKPIPFGVIFPKDYNAHYEHSHSNMQSQNILTGNDDLTVAINVRFLHLRKTELFQKNSNSDNNDDYAPAFSLDIYGNIYQAGWQTIERKISTGNLRVSELAHKSKIILFEFDSMNEGEIIFNEQKEVVAKTISSVAEIKGTIKIKAGKVKDSKDAFRLTVSVTNLTPVTDAPGMTRDDAMLQSFLSTHIILHTGQGEFISHQDPPDEWKKAIASCENLNTWPILIDKSNSTLLSSPVILYDYPEINPLSSGDLFDSTEIEEALLLHVNLLSDEEKKRIGSNDKKLHAMLNKVSGLTPGDLAVYHSMMKESAPGEFDNK
jgi:hypothetical protein